MLGDSGESKAPQKFHVLTVGAVNSMSVSSSIVEGRSAQLPTDDWAYAGKGASPSAITQYHDFILNSK